jgi:hypothetical protein
MVSEVYNGCISYLVKIVMTHITQMSEVITNCKTMTEKRPQIKFVCSINQTKGGKFSTVTLGTCLNSFNGQIKLFIILDPSLSDHHREAGTMGIFEQYDGFIMEYSAQRILIPLKK